MTDTLSAALAQRALSSPPPREPTADDRALLRLWGWRELRDGRWLVPEGKYARTWREALHRIEKDRAAGDEP